MPIEILMPALSPTMEEGNLVNWLKKEGDKIFPGDVIAEIETDKATMEVEAVDEGILGRILVAAGTEAVKVNVLIALLLEEGEDPSVLEGYASSFVVSSTAPESPNESLGAATNATNPEVSVNLLVAEGRVFATPLARRLAEQKGVSLSGIPGTGPHGRIVKADVDSYTPAKAAVSYGASGAVGGISPPEDIKLSNMRKVIAKRLTESKQEIPHFYLTVACELDALLKVRADVNATREKESRISVNDFIIKGLASAMMMTPEANVMWMGDALRQFHTFDLSVAVAIDGGLVTPIIKSAERKSLSQISLEMRDLAARAREGKLKPEEFQGGSFSLSNLGMFGVDEFNAIINPPQAGILAVGSGVEQAVVKDGNLTVATVMRATLSVDHRAIDGAVGAKLLGNFKKMIENPVRMLV